jgi:hypothetical protein
MTFFLVMEIQLALFFARAEGAVKNFLWKIGEYPIKGRLFYQKK